MNVFVLEHEREIDGHDDVKMVGVYASRLDAEKARERALSLPGFTDHEDGFSICEYELGRDHWTSGFVTVDEAGNRMPAVGGDSRAA